MKWFKHFTNRRRDRDLSAARETLGGEAIDIYWQTYELVAEHFSRRSDSESLSGSSTFFSDNIPGYSWRKIRKVWEFFGESSREKQLIIYEEKDGVVTVTIPNLNKIADEYSKRLKRNVRTNSVQKAGQTPELREDIRREEKKSKKTRAKRPPIPSATYEKIIGYLNEATGKSFLHYDKETRLAIKNKIYQGYTEEKLITVIDNQCRVWLGDERMEQYLTPQTLFGKNIDKYLNNIVPKKKRSVDPMKLVH